MSNGMTPKQQRWADAYLGEARFNMTEASRITQYKGNDVTLASVGYENFRKPHIREYIEQRLSEAVMTSDETLMHLAEIARPPVTHFDFFVHEMATIEGDDGEQVEVIRTVINGDMVKKYGHLIKTVSFTNAGPKIEFYNRLDALVHIGKHHGLFTEKHEHTGDVTVRFTWGDDDSDHD